MPAGYDPYQQNFQWGSALGDVGGNIIKILAMLGGMGTGPFKGLEGLIGGVGGGKEDEEEPNPQVIQGGGGQPPPQIQQPMPLAPMGGPQMGAPMGPMPGGQGGPPMGPQGGPQQDQIMKMIMALLQQQGGPPMGGMMG